MDRYRDTGFSRIRTPPKVFLVHIWAQAVFKGGGKKANWNS